MTTPTQRSTHPLLRILNHAEASDAACLLHSLAFGKKDRKTLFSNVANADGTPALDSNGHVYEKLGMDLSLGSGEPPDSILVLSEYRTALKDIEQWFNGGPDDIPTPIVPDDYIWSRWGDFPVMDNEQSNEQESDSSSRDPEQQDPSASSVMKNRKNANILPMSTWYLVDSNQRISAPPEVIRGTRARIVQASSPKSSRLDWVKKATRDWLRYMMKPPTLKEIILMRDCQALLPMRSISDPMIRSFWDKYGPSARSIFANAYNPSAYEEKLIESIAGINAEALAALAEKVPKVLDPDGVSHLILGVYPGALRSDLFVNILTKHIFQLIKNANAAKEDMAMHRMHRPFNNNPQTRAAAGYIFEDRLHELLLRGGMWKADRLVQSGKDHKNFSYTQNTDSHAGSRWLCVGQLSYLADDEPGEAMLPLELHRCDAQSITNSELTQSGIYYQPDSLMYDSHVVNTQEKQVVVFQFTVASKHDVKVSDLVWLKQRYGDAGYRVNYVVFADPESETTIYIPRAYDSVLAEKLLVIVKEDELFPPGFRKDSTAEKRRAGEESDGQVSKKICVEK
ncbi:hypothetical protein VNI00_015370 [Paramarasmius palmivorus]|uniref:Uncharacterized protein n=1 Tax=Paramarasmius palmivorus TaxID=297713 RepID=A0AAW0BPK6_9AGAR